MMPGNSNAAISDLLVQMLTLASAVTRDALWAARVGHVA